MKKKKKEKQSARRIKYCLSLIYQSVPAPRTVWSVISFLFVVGFWEKRVDIWNDSFFLWSYLLADSPWPYVNSSSMLWGRKTWLMMSEGPSQCKRRVLSYPLVILVVSFSFIWQECQRYTESAFLLMRVQALWKLIFNLIFICFLNIWETIMV